jgi:hypothetical protein
MDRLAAMDAFVRVVDAGCLGRLTTSDPCKVDVQGCPKAIACCQAPTWRSVGPSLIRRRSFGFCGPPI